MRIPECEAFFASILRYALRMRIAYINHSRFPTEKAHGLQTAQVCAAMAELGHAVKLLTPTMRGADASKAFDFYGLKKNFSIEQLEHFDPFQSRLVPGVLGFVVSMHFYAKALKTYLKNHHFDLLYVRSPHLASALLETGQPVVLELHTLPEHGKKRFVQHCNRCVLVVCLTKPMRDELISWGANPQKVITEGDGVDLERFSHHPEATAAKKKQSLPSDRIIVGYVGSFVTREVLEKGVRESIDALALLKDRKHVSFFGWMVGGSDQWIEIYMEHARARGLMDEDIRLDGHISSAEVPAALAACDILVYPAPASSHPYFLRDTSPLKLFEYLASGRPIVCADLPPLKGVVDATTVRLCRPGDPAALAEAIADIAEHRVEAQKRAKAGLELVKQYSWIERMRRILKAIA